MKGALNILESTIREKAGFSFEELNLLERVGKCTVPALFVASKKDSFVRCHHSEKLNKLYTRGLSEIVYFDGDHNEQRSPRTTRDCIEFLKVNLLLMKKTESNKTKSQATSGTATTTTAMTTATTTTSTTPTH